MINLSDSINNINFLDEETESGYEIEYKEHYESVLELVKNEEIAKKIIKAIERNHKEENKNYYTYLKKMEKEMNS
jgi:hypothetical protein